MSDSTELEEARNLRSFLACRSEIHHEYDLLSGRLNSYITSQAFLVSAYAISMGNMNTTTGREFRLGFPLLLSLVAITLSLRAIPGIVGACDTITFWHERQAQLFESGKGLEDYAILHRDPVKQAHDRNLLFAQTSPWIFGLAWLLMAAFAIHLYLG